MKNYRPHSILLLILVVSCFSCKNDSGSNAVTDFFKPSVLDIGAVNEALSLQSFGDSSVFMGTDSLFTASEVSNLIAGKSEVWYDKFGLNENGTYLMKQLKNAKLEGLNPEDYGYSTLDSLLQQKENLSAEKLAEVAKKMTLAYFMLSKDLLLGKVKPLALNKDWQNKNDTTWSVDSLIQWTNNKNVKEVLNDLRPQHPWYKKFQQTAKRLAQLNLYRMDRSELPSKLELGDSTAKIKTLRTLLQEIADTSLDKNSMVWDMAGVNALGAYQEKFGLPQSGSLDSVTVAALTQPTDKNIEQLGLNMERMRWLEKDFASEFIWVNIPQMEVDYFENDSVTFNMRAVVGRLSRKTPTLDSKLSNIVFNPPWYVPPTIMKQEVLPGILRRGGSYLARRGLVARDRRGRKINPSRINAKNYRRYSISQNPGRNSALGSVKFNFPNKEAIFLHDTNHRGDFGRKYRAFSSGCIRVHHPKDFAKFILRDSTYNEEGIEKIIKNKATKSVKVKRDVNVHIVYLTNAIDKDGNVVKVKDIYKWDPTLAAQL